MSMPSERNPVRAHQRGTLTAREQEILALLTAGDSVRDIAAQLGITTGTAASHVRSIYRKIGAKPANERDDDVLTRREHEVLALLAAGNSTPDIAAQLAVSSGTVKTHLTNVYRKIGAKNRVQAARYYLDQLAPASEA
jgi:DNA-binding CsgD family transcriptional regulator